MTQIFYSIRFGTTPGNTFEVIDFSYQQQSGLEFVCVTTFEMNGNVTRYVYIVMKRNVFCIALITCAPWSIKYWLSITLVGWSFTAHLTLWDIWCQFIYIYIYI